MHHDHDDNEDAPEGAGAPRPGASPYATGGGGVTLERRVASSYLALLLTGATAPELGDDRCVSSVRFQQAPRDPVDDIVISATRPGEAARSLVLSIGVRRRPNLVRSDAEAQKLIVEYVRALLQMPNEGIERRLGLAVAGTQAQAAQLADLTVAARRQQDAAAFFALLRERGRFAKPVVDRLGHVEQLVKRALVALGSAEPPSDVVALRTWKLLERLWVLPQRLEEPDTTGWADVQNRLLAVARGRDLTGAGRLRDRLEVLAGQYAPGAATVDGKLLRRDVHALLEPGRRRHDHGWQLLEQIDELARRAVRDRLGTGEGSLALDLQADVQALLATADASAAVVVSGESGVGKSSLALAAAGAVVQAGGGDAQAICLDLRQLPENWLDLAGRLGAPLAEVLSEMSAPGRYLVIDGAEAAAESRRDVFSYVVAAASGSEVHLVVVVAVDVREVVRDLLIAQLGEDEVRSHEVTTLGDARLADVVAAFPRLRRLVNTPRSRELLRRLVVIDLLVRSDVTGVPLSDADALHEIWTGLVRRREQRDRGLPDARDGVMVQLAAHVLLGKSPTALDAEALDGLRQDGLLRPVQSNPWQVVPEFAHDEIRRYAVARLLLTASDVGAAVLQAGAPRWALSAATLAAQFVLSRPDGPDTPLRGRLAAIQASFDAVAANNGARWADVPTEALLGLGDPRPVLADAWPELQDERAAGLDRLLRVLDQRHAPASVLDPVVAEPVLESLLDDPAPWRISDRAAAILRDGLLGLVVAEAPTGHPVRLRLRQRIVDECERGQAQLDAARQEQEAERAARSPEQKRQDHEREQQQAALADVILGPPRRRARRRRELPRVLTDKTVVELLALLGPDLGDDGEGLLRRIASEWPNDLAPALEELGAGRALGDYGHGLLADLVEAYYLDDDESGLGSSFHDDGIRRHRFDGSFGPLAAWYRGPFMPLFQTDPWRGIAVLNRLLNHAARARSRTLAGHGDPWGRVSEENIARIGAELRVAGELRKFEGDDHVWRWYRGTAVGPYPCMSALQALERYCDQLLSWKVVSVERLIAPLLDGCENLAMPGLIVGLLVRHVESAGRLLDPFLAEPMVWHLEFVRVTGEASGFAATSEGLVHPERRAWSLREAATWLTLNADEERAQELRDVGKQLVTHAVELAGAGEGGDDEDDEGADPIAVVRGWASALDRSAYRAQDVGDRLVVEHSPPDEVQAALAPDNEDLRRGQEALRIQMRYLQRTSLSRDERPPPNAEELAADLIIARGLVDDPPTRSAVGPGEMATAIAAHGLRAQLSGDAELDEDAQRFVVEVILRVAEQTPVPDSDALEDSSYYEMGADRLAAGALPSLLVPTAAPLLALLGTQPEETVARIFAAGLRLARANATETRLHLARGLDAVWKAPCQADGACHHRRGLELALESMRDCVLGSSGASRRSIERLDDPVVETLAAVPDANIYVAKFHAALRALGRAAVSDACVAENARRVLLEVLAAQRRGFVAHEENYDDRGSSALVAARALLALATASDDQPLRDHLDAYSERGEYLNSLLRALAAAAEEDEDAAAAARDLWPSIIEQVLRFDPSGHELFSHRYFGEQALAALAPTTTGDVAFLYRELAGPALAWRDPLGWQDALDAWLPVAAGRANCIDAFIGLTRELSVAQQLSFALPRVATLAEGDTAAAATTSWLLAEWLKELRAGEMDGEALAVWQHLVDALVVSGNRTLAPYSQ